MLTATLDGAARAWVDGGGLVTPAGASWALDWWLGADDRWYLPAREATVRQRRLGAGPVVETTVRIPSGDARQTVYGALVDGRPATVVEVHNDSPVPIALALAMRPFAVGPPPPTAAEARTGGPRRLDLDETVLRLDSERAVVLPRPPAQSGGSATHDLLDDLLAGRDLSWSTPSAQHRPDGSLANAVVLYPLPHRTSLRFLVIECGALEPNPPPGPARAPDAATVTAGWTSVVDATTSLTFPDPGLTDAVAAARARLLLAATDLPAQLSGLTPGSGAQLAALAACGRTREVAPILDAAAGSFPHRLHPGDDGSGAAEIVEALALAAELGGLIPEPALLEFAVQTVRLSERPQGRRRWRRVPPTEQTPVAASAKRGLARLALAAGDRAGASQLLGELSRYPAGDRGSESVQGGWLSSAPDAAELDERRAEASAAVSWGHDDPEVAARFVLGARALLVGHDPAADGEVVLLPGFVPSWRGGSLDAHQLPIGHGLLSMAVRWHGARPALLWELVPRSDQSGPTPPVRFSCPRLDPGWSSTEPSGEALLAGSADGLPDAPMPGDSFS